MPSNRLQGKQMSKSSAIANIFLVSLRSVATVIGGVALLTLSAKIQIRFR
jgi:hypothetical protein